MMKSPTSLIRFRNAVGVVLALSAVFAVVISTISLTSDGRICAGCDEDEPFPLSVQRLGGTSVIVPR